MGALFSNGEKTDTSSWNNLNSFELGYCGLGYGVLMNRMHHSISQRLTSGRLASCAILIHGPQGVGKRSLARLLAAQLLTEHPWLSYGVPEFLVSLDCPSEGLFGTDQTQSTMIKEPLRKLWRFSEKILPSFWMNAVLEWEKERQKLDSHPEYRVLLPGSNLEDIRQFRQKLSHTRSGDSFRVVVLPEAHSLGISSINALLKWIENPGPRTVFILTASGSLPPTVTSRCLSFPMPALDWSAFSRVRAWAHTLGDRTLILEDDHHGNKTTDRFQLWAKSEYDVFKISQGCLIRTHYWQEHLPWVKTSWALLHRCATHSPVMDSEWLKTALCLEGSVWDFWYIWARDMYSWAYEHGFLHHWDHFWTDTWLLILQHQVYHTDTSSLIQTVLARIHGFFTYYGVDPMPNSHPMA